MSSRRVLIIEDLKDAAESLRDAVELLGHAVEVAYDGPSGISLAQAFVPEVILCDIGLPVLDGYAVARALREDARLRTAYLVALSGYALQQDIEKAKQAGFDRHLAKPARLEDLQRLILEAPSYEVSAPR